ncbi:hypothetical protein STEG23_021417 [Scotinomys teguina]
MEADTLSPVGLGLLLLLPLLITLLAALCVRCRELPEPSCENVDEDEEEDDYPNEGYLEVLPDSTPAAAPVISSAPVPSNPGLRDSAFSMESGEDYVNVPESEDSAEASLDGSREYVNVSQELQPVTRADLGVYRGVRGAETGELPSADSLQAEHQIPLSSPPPSATLKSQEVEDEEEEGVEEEEAPDYENLQELS